MNLIGLVPYLLFLHVFGAIAAFGPTFGYSIMGSLAGREPQHANFSARQVVAISNTLVYPLAIVQAITGVVLIVAAQINVDSAPWLLIGIVLYVIALTFSLTIQRSALHHLVELTSTPPPPGAPPGPPPGVAATVKQIQRGGAFTGLLIVVIVFMMVVKPTF